MTERLSVTGVESLYYVPVYPLLGRTIRNPNIPRVWWYLQKYRYTPGFVTVKEPVAVMFPGVPVVSHGTEFPSFMHPSGDPTNMSSVKWFIWPASDAFIWNRPVGNSTVKVWPSSVSLLMNVRITASP